MALGSQKRWWGEGLGERSGVNRRGRQIGMEICQQIHLRAGDYYA